MVIRRVGVFSVARVMAAMYALMGLVLGGIATLLAMIGAGIGGGGRNAGIGAAVFGVGAVILLPLFYGALGFIAGMIGAFLYNTCASVVGGIELGIAPRLPDESRTPEFG